MKPAAVLCEFNGNVAAQADDGNIKEKYSAAREWKNKKHNNMTGNKKDCHTNFWNIWIEAQIISLNQF